MANINIEEVLEVYNSIHWPQYIQDEIELSDTTKKEYKNLFYNAFELLKIDRFNKESSYHNRAIQDTELNEIVEDFQSYFPRSGRIDDLKGFYLDDRIEANIRFYNNTLKSPVKLSLLNLEFHLSRNNEKHREKKTASLEDIERNPSLSLNQEYSRIKAANTYLEHYEQFKDLNALSLHISQVKAFNNLYGDNPPKRAYLEELNKIKEFIKEAEQTPILEAFKTTNSRDNKNELYQYIRLTSNYYQDRFNTLLQSGLTPPIFNLFDSNSALVYAKYILCKEWLENQITSPSNKAFLALCTWLDETGIMEQGEQTKQSFIEGVFNKYKLCQEFNLNKIPERVIKQFRIDTPDKKDIEEAKERLVPLLSETERQIVLNHIEH